MCLYVDSSVGKESLSSLPAKYYHSQSDSINTDDLKGYPVPLFQIFGHCVQLEVCS